MYVYKWNLYSKHPKDSLIKGCPHFVGSFVHSYVAGSVLMREMFSFQGYPYRGWGGLHAIHSYGSPWHEYDNM